MWLGDQEGCSEEAEAVWVKTWGWEEEGCVWKLANAPINFYLTWKPLLWSQPTVLVLLQTSTAYTSCRQSSFCVRGGNSSACSANEDTTQQDLSPRAKHLIPGGGDGPKPGLWSKERTLKNMSTDQEVSQREEQTQSGQGWSHVHRCPSSRLLSRTEPRRRWGPMNEWMNK